MKTKITLTIIGVFNVLQATLYAAFASSSVDMMFNVGEEAQSLAVLFQYAITPAFFMIGLIFLFLRDLELEQSKKLLLSMIIAYIPLFCAFYYISSSPLTNMGVQDFAIDIVMFMLAVFTYFKGR